MPVDQSFNFRRINAQVSTAGVISAEQLSSLGDEGYQVVINLLPGGSDYAVAGERELVTRQGLDYHYIPVDFAAPDAADLAHFSSTLSGIGDKTVMIHCAANYRVSAFFAIYAIHHLGWSREQGLSHIASLWNPQEFPGWSAFIEGAIESGGNYA